MWLGRKITRAKWERDDGIDEKSIPADAFVDMRTSGNALSWWDCGDNDEPQLETIVIALSGDQDRLDKWDCVCVKMSDLTSKGLMFENTEGKTIAPDLKAKHYDLVQLDGFGLLEAAYAVDASLKEPLYKRFAKSEVKEILQGAINAGRINHADLNNNLQESLARPKAE